MQKKVTYLIQYKPTYFPMQNMRKAVLETKETSFHPQ